MWGIIVVVAVGLINFAFADLRGVEFITPSASGCTCSINTSINGNVSAFGEPNALAFFLTNNSITSINNTNYDSNGNLYLGVNVTMNNSKLSFGLNPTIDADYGYLGIIPDGATGYNFGLFTIDDFSISTYAPTLGRYIYAGGDLYLDLNKFQFVMLHDLNVSGNITAKNFIGSGKYLTDIPSSMNYTNIAMKNQSNVFTPEQNFSSNIVVDGDLKMKNISVIYMGNKKFGWYNPNTGSWYFGNAGKTGTTGPQNFGLGDQAMSSISTGAQHNNCQGGNCMYSLTSGTENDCSGFGCMFSLTSSSDENACVGGSCLSQITSSADGNSAVGYKSCRGQTGGSANMCLGNRIDVPNPTGSGQLNIGGVIYGINLFSAVSDITTSVPTPNGAISIGQQTPRTGIRFDVNGTIGMVSNSTAQTCSSTNEGAIYYNGGTKKHYGCNSTDWNALY